MLYCLLKYKGTNVCTHTHTHTLAHMHKHITRFKHACMHTLTTCLKTYTTHTHTHTPSLSRVGTQGKGTSLPAVRDQVRHKQDCGGLGPVELSATDKNREKHSVLGRFAD